MKKTLTLFITLTFFLTSCTTTGSIDYSVTYNSYNDLPIYKGIVFGYGTGDTMEEASIAALGNISNQVEVKVTYLTDLDSKIESRNGEIVEDTLVLEESTNLASDVKLKLAKRLDYKIDVNGRYYVLMYYETVKNQFFNEKELVAYIRDKELTNRIFTTTTSSFIPGTGQLMNRDTKKGAILLVSGISLLTSGIISMIASNQFYTDYAQAVNSTERDYYWENSNLYSTVGIVSFSLYGALAIYSGVDNYASQR